MGRKLILGDMGALLAVTALSVGTQGGTVILQNPDPPRRREPEPEKKLKLSYFEVSARENIHSAKKMSAAEAKRERKAKKRAAIAKAQEAGS